MISCYALLAVYLSTAGTLDVALLEHMYNQLKNQHSTTYLIQSHKGMYEVIFDAAPKKESEGTEAQQCELSGEHYYGSLAKQ